eukprot:gnl/TRDRNA2_/TRDRNA2_42771_c0_seq1.p1 gnl/TRDRNA2_/TRDRNA2_42771_c0~~gnl/TRDRNA2_/TRDRNA2_42771_c0_seq1.p1  ORF type:complete len:382 (-),score=82.90 gnl/TRDRNA2_/TRDRNA2_42771_c0_seq1:84-1229(-)
MNQSSAFHGPESGPFSVQVVRPAELAKNVTDWADCVKIFNSDESWKARSERLAETSCHWLALSKALSIGVVAGACVGRMPQVYNICKARSAEGVSPLSLWIEVVLMGVQVAYNIVRRTPLSTYWEQPILFGQVLLLILVAAKYDRRCGPRVCILCFGIISGVLGMALEFVPASVTAAVYGAGTLCGLLVAGPQILLNYRRRSTGQLSLVVAAMNMSGTTTRLFTTWLEVDDVMLQIACTMNFTLAAAILIQFWLYWGHGRSEEGELSTWIKAEEIGNMEVSDETEMQMTPRLTREYSAKAGSEDDDSFPEQKKPARPSPRIVKERAEGLSSEELLEVDREEPREEAQDELKIVTAQAAEDVSMTFKVFQEKLSKELKSKQG